MLTIQDVQNDAAQLTQGKKSPCVKFALWIAALSAQQALAANGRLARLLVKYVNKPLPDTDTLVAYLKTGKACIVRNHITAIYHIEALEQEGLLESLENIGDGYEAQNTWRDHVYGLMHGWGMSYKTISFAAMLLDPTHCELVPIDRHVLARLDIGTDWIGKREDYLACESIVFAEREEAGMDYLPLTLWHWYKWEEYRQVQGISRASGGIETHYALSCYNY